MDLHLTFSGGDSFFVFSGADVCEMALLDLLVRRRRQIMELHQSVLLRLLRLGGGGGGSHGGGCWREKKRKGDGGGAFWL